MKEDINNNSSLTLIDALIELGKQFNNQLKEYSNNSLFGEIFNDMNDIKKEFKEIDNSIKDEDDKKELNHAHIETTETEKSYSYSFRDDSPKTHDEIIDFLKQKLNDFTFAACSENEKKYKLKFIFNNNIHYGFEWDKNVMHFLGETNDPDFVFVNEDFYFDETKNDFFVCEFDKKEECDLKEITDECCDKKCEDDTVNEQCPCDCEVTCQDEDPTPIYNDNPNGCDRGCDGNISYTADTLFDEVNKDVDAAIENDLLPIIKGGIDRIFNYKLYTIDRTGNIPGFDIIVFTLEDVRLNCEQHIVNNFWEFIPYKRIVRFLVETYNFPKVFILDKNTKDGYVHEVRCHLK